MFRQFDVLWTPTVLALDSTGRERYRLEGYVPRDEFAAQLRLGLAGVGFMRKAWNEAEAIYDEIVRRLPDTWSAAEAIYWRGVCRYRQTHSGDDLAHIVDDFASSNHRDSIWAAKASVWRK